MLTEARSLATLADLQKFDQFVLRLLIVGLVWNFVWDFYVRWFAILRNIKAALESLKSLKMAENL